MSQPIDSEEAAIVPGIEYRNIAATLKRLKMFFTFQLKADRPADKTYDEIEYKRGRTN